MNVARDLLRKRRRREYVGVWLPSPVETGDEAADETPSAEARYDQVESATLAFLLALEALSPNQRAVLLLRDVFDRSVRETADALGLTEANVKTTHLRARRALAPYDDARRRPTRPVQQQTRAALERLVTALATGEREAVDAMLAADARSFADGGGVYFAARHPVEGREAVARLYSGLAGKAGRVRSSELVMLNGLPALVLRMEAQPQGWAPLVVLQCEVDDDGRVARLYSVMAPAKLRLLAG
jgi:hypothetical protein